MITIVSYDTLRYISYPHTAVFVHVPRMCRALTRGHPARTQEQQGGPQHPMCPLYPHHGSYEPNPTKILQYLGVFGCFLIRIFPCRSPDAAFTRPPRSSTPQTGGTSASGACCDYAQPTHTPACVFTVREIHPAGSPPLQCARACSLANEHGFCMMPSVVRGEAKKGRKGGKKGRGKGKKRGGVEKKTGPKEPP